jgi:hypothetical protein
MDPNYVLAHKNSCNHREEILQSDLCACFYCLATFPPETIDEWVDDRNGVGTTALCPECAMDSVIGSASGYPITRDFLRAMRNHYF